MPTIIAPDGRRVGYEVRGDASGVPIFYFHGWGESRLTCPVDHATASALSIQLVTIDRPGTGLSDPRSHPTLLKTTEDVAAVANRLGIVEFAVLGRSAGAAFAITCAWRFPNRVRAAAIVSGVAPPSRRALRALLTSDFRRLALWLWLARPLARPTLGLGAGAYRHCAHRRLARRIRRLPPADQLAFASAEAREERTASLLEALRQRGAGLHHDATLLAQHWGFELEELAVPTHVWHGAKDTLVRPACGAELVRRLRPAGATLCRDGGHHMLFTHAHLVLSTLREAAMKPRKDPLRHAGIPAAASAPVVWKCCDCESAHATT